MTKQYFTIFFHLLSVSFALGQITVTFPTDRVVFQRNNLNTSQVHIGGYLTECMESIEARFVPIKSNPTKPVLGQPSPANGGWTVMQSTRTCGNFSGSLTVSGGWYRLEVRGIRSAEAPIVSTVQHVGVGEVFLVAGQSNVTGGDANPSGPGATEDAVSSVDFRNINNDPYKSFRLPCPEYVHLDQFTKTAPFGNYAWCWGSFGDKLVEKLRVPVMIFNAGWSATGVENWQQSIPPDGVTKAWFGADYPAGLPFGHLRIALNNYIAQLGIRAVLWHQGETDTMVGTSREKYRNDLRSVIQESRTLSGKPDLAWLVSRASRYTFKAATEGTPSSHTSAQVIAAQNDVIGLGTNGADPAYKLNNTFEGPQTDSYWDSTYRSDQVHFVGNGLLFLAQLWVDKITQNFMTTSVPYAAIAPPRVTLSSSGGSAQTMAAENGWSAYNWLNQGDCNRILSSSQQQSAGTGYYRLKTIDSYNNSVLSPAFYIPEATLPVTWKYFRGQSGSNNTVMLQWATASETNASYFEVQRGTNPFTFSSVYKKAAYGNSSTLQEYTYEDNALQPGIYYYRLKQVDRDEKYTFSRIISLTIENDESIVLFPNPVSDQLNIQSETSIHSLEIINALGINMLTSPQPGNLQKLDMSKYPAGLYTIKVNGKSFKILRN